MNFPIVKMAESTELTGRDFVGVSQSADHGLQVTVPYGIVISDVVSNLDTNNMRFLKIYVKAIQKALNDKSVRYSIDEVTAGINHPLAAVNIIYDYITMGPLIEFETSEVLSNLGKMDLNRTIQKVTPSYINDDLIYDKYITRKQRVVRDNYVAIVQANIINHFMKNGGELLFGSNLKAHAKPLKLDRTVSLKLRKEIGQTFNSRKLTVIQWMLEYLSGAFISDESKGHWNYAIIASTLWEVMVDRVFGNQVSRNKTKYGKRYSLYSIEDKRTVFTGKPTEHDTICETDDEVIIIDAKMYGRDSNLLSEEVLGKQFGYYVEAKKEHPAKRVINVLFLPASNSGAIGKGFSNQVITDPHSKATDDPDKIIFIYHYPANELVKDYYYARRLSSEIHDDFEAFIHKPTVRKYLDSRHTSY